MLQQPTLQLLYELRLPGMAAALEEQQGMPNLHDLGFEDRLALLLEREKAGRADRRFQRLLGQAQLRLDAVPEDLDFRKTRSLDRSLVLRLMSCDWIREGQSLLITGATGSGKSYLACALGHQACRHGLSVRYCRLSRLLTDLILARADGSYAKRLQRLARVQLLILDDWGLASLDDLGRRDLLEVLDDRYGRKATLVTSQIPVDHWHEIAGDATFADAILDRMVHNAHRIILKGGSLRRVYDSTRAGTSDPPATTD